MAFLKPSRRSSQQTRVPGNTLGEVVLLVVFIKNTLSRFKDQREGRGVIRGFREKQASLRSRPEHLLREGLRMKCMVVYRREVKAPNGVENWEFCVHFVMSATLSALCNPFNPHKN